MAVVQTLHQLPHEAADVLMGELDKARLQQAHQVVVHVLKHQVKSTWNSRGKMCSDIRHTIIQVQRLEKWSCDERVAKYFDQLSKFNLAQSQWLDYNEYSPETVQLLCFVTSAQPATVQCDVYFPIWKCKLSLPLASALLTGGFKGYRQAQPKAQEGPMQCSMVDP